MWTIMVMTRAESCNQRSKPVYTTSEHIERIFFVASSIIWTTGLVWPVTLIFGSQAVEFPRSTEIPGSSVGRASGC